jgi:hypothetical protein
MAEEVAPVNIAGRQPEITKEAAINNEYLKKLDLFMSNLF